MSDVRIVEVGPRDGLQNEKQPIPTTTKLALIDKLGAVGLREIETTSFVSPRRIPQVADHTAVMKSLVRRPGVRYPVLTPNLRGYQNAREAGADCVAVFASASEAFSQKNIECSIEESFARFAPIFEHAAKDGVEVRGYVSCVVACPYEGPVAAEKVAVVAKRLLDAGCYEISLGDTIGVGTPATVELLLERVTKDVPVGKIAGHFHDTYGMAVANVYAAWRLGVRTFDASVGGLGGCPYAKGATGNLATEDLVYMLHDLGETTGVDLEGLVDVAAFMAKELGRPVQSRVGRALLAKRTS